MRKSINRKTLIRTDKVPMLLEYPIGENLLKYNSIRRVMKIPNKYKIYKFKFDKENLNNINTYSFIEDRIYTVSVYCISFFLLAMLTVGGKIPVLLMCIYVLLNILYRKNLQKIKGNKVKLITYILINALPLIYIGDLIIGGSKLIVPFLVVTYIVTYSVFMKNSKVEVNDAYKPIIMVFVWFIIVFIASMFKNSTYIISSILYFITNHIAFNSFLEIKYVLKNNQSNIQ